MARLSPEMGSICIAASVLPTITVAGVEAPPERNIVGFQCVVADREVVGLLHAQSRMRRVDDEAHPGFPDLPVVRLTGEG